MANSSQVQKLARLARSSESLLSATTRRQYATHADLPQIRPAPKTTVNPFITNVIATTYRWPSMEPTAFTSFSSQHLGLPLRKDILHRAVVYEADGKRAGLASTKHRSNMRGSGRKLRPQKGTGRARLSDRKSPMLRGGGVAHGPHPRDFSTDLPDKVYSLAFRTALSYRYRKGELIIIGDKISSHSSRSPRWLHNIFAENGWGSGNGRTMVVVGGGAGRTTQRVTACLELGKQIGEDAVFRDAQEVGVKDLLMCGRVMIELKALQHILTRRSKGVEHLTTLRTTSAAASESVSL